MLDRNHFGYRGCEHEFELLLKTIQGEPACSKLRFQVGSDGCLLVLSRCDVQRLNDPTSRRIGISAAFHLLPEFAPV